MKLNYNNRENHRLDITDGFKHCRLGLWVFAVQGGGLQEDIRCLCGVGCMNLGEPDGTERRPTLRKRRVRASERRRRATKGVSDLQLKCGSQLGEGLHGGAAEEGQDLCLTEDTLERQDTRQWNTAPRRGCGHRTGWASYWASYRALWFLRTGLDPIFLSNIRVLLVFVRLFTGVILLVVTATVVVLVVVVLLLFLILVIFIVLRVSFVVTAVGSKRSFNRVSRLILKFQSDIQQNLEGNHFI